MRPHDGDPREQPEPESGSQESSGEGSESSSSDSEEWTDTESSSSSDSGHASSCSCSGLSTLEEEHAPNCNASVPSELPLYSFPEEQELPRTHNLFKDLGPGCSCIGTESSLHGAAAAAEEDGRQSKKQGRDVLGGGSDERVAAQDDGAEEAKAASMRSYMDEVYREDSVAHAARGWPQYSSPGAGQIDAAGFGSQHDGNVRTATWNPISKSNQLTPDVVEATGILFALLSTWDSTRESTDGAAQEDGHDFKKQDHDAVAGMHHADISVDGSNEEAVLRVSPKKRKRPVYDQQNSPSPFSGKGNDDFKPLIPDINLPAPEEEGDSGTGKPELKSWWPGSNMIRMDDGSPRKTESDNNDECEAAMPDINLPPPAEGGD